MSNPAFPADFRDNRPPLLAVGANDDPFFLPPGAEAFKRDLPDADVRFYDIGRFALETHAAEIEVTLVEFLTRVAGGAR